MFLPAPMMKAIGLFIVVVVELGPCKSKCLVECESDCSKEL